MMTSAIYRQTIEDLEAAGDLEGYVRGRPPWVAGWALASDREVLAAERCAHCGDAAGLVQITFYRDQDTHSWREFGVCRACRHAVEV